MITEINMNWVKKKIKKWIFDDEVEAINSGHEKYLPKLYGEHDAVTYEIDGIDKSTVTVVEWPSGEGVDVSIDTEVSKGKWEEKKISLHDDELLTLLYCLNHLKRFEK